MINFIKSILTFKEKVQEVLNNQVVREIVDFIKETIICLKDTELTNLEKKKRLDTLTIELIKKKCKSDNIFVQFLIDALLECVPLITQLVYDLLKLRVEGITKKEVV